MSTLTVVAFALGMAVLGIHVLHACPLSTGMCKQYGHACLGGHGKRAENPNPRLMDYILKKMLHSSDQDTDSAARSRNDLQRFWEKNYETKMDDWENDPEDGLGSNIFTAMN